MPSSLCASEWVVAGPSVFQALSGDRVTRIELQEVARDHLSLAGLPTSLSSNAHLLKNGPRGAIRALETPAVSMTPCRMRLEKASFCGGNPSQASGSWRQPVSDRSSPCGEAAALARTPMHLHFKFLQATAGDGR
jgi:hypothetical protein